MRNTDDNGAVRFSVSMEPELLSRLDELASESRTRSKIIRDLLREHLAQTGLKAGKGRAVGVLSFIYCSSQPELCRRLAELQHKEQARVVSSTRIHLDRNDCFELLILRGPAQELKRLADRVLALHGVRQGQLSLTPAKCPLAKEHRD